MPASAPTAREPFLVLPGFLPDAIGFASRTTLSLLLAVSAVYLFLLLGPDSGEPILPDRWLGALLVAGVGALVMTRRLMLHRDGVQVV